MDCWKNQWIVKGINRIYNFRDDWLTLSFLSTPLLISFHLQINHGSIHGKNFGILDFFGFEINKTNKFEQLIINYCSEKLHQVSRKIYIIQRFANKIQYRMTFRAFYNVYSKINKNCISKKDLNGVKLIFSTMISFVI